VLNSCPTSPSVVILRISGFIRNSFNHFAVRWIVGTHKMSVQVLILLRTVSQFYNKFRSSENRLPLWADRLS
jgi:hypothetical protein